MKSKRTITIKVLVSKREQAEIKRRVPMGMTLSGYMRWTALRDIENKTVQVDEHLK